MRKLIVQPLALSEQRRILYYSRRVFGDRAARAYEQLFRQAFKRLCADPNCAGVVQDSALGNFRLFHLRHARIQGAPPKRPRHLIVFASDETTLTIIRILHESMDIADQVSDSNGE